MPPGAPSALASASFAAKRAASDSAVRSWPGLGNALRGGEQPVGQLGVRCERRGETVDRNYVDADADDHALGDCPRRRVVGQVARERRHRSGLRYAAALLTAVATSPKPVAISRTLPS